MSDIKIINKNIIGAPRNPNTLSKVFDSRYFYEYKLLGEGTEFFNILPVTDNLYAHYDVMDLYALHGSKNNPVSLSQWPDKSGNNRHLIQPTEANQPFFNKFITPHPGVTFSNGNRRMYSEENFTELAGLNSKSIFCVFAKCDANMNSDMCVCGISGAAGTGAWFTIYTDSRDYRFAGYSRDNNNSFRSLSKNPRVAVATFSDTDTPSKLKCYMNNIQYTPISETLNTNDYIFLVGDSVTSSIYPPSSSYGSFNGIIYEIVVYSEALSEAEVASVSDFLMTKYQIAEEI